MKKEKNRSLKTLRFRQKRTTSKEYTSKEYTSKEYRCPLCSLKVDVEDFRNKVFVKEFETTGLCQGCLDMFFGYRIAW